MYILKDETCKCGGSICVIDHVAEDKQRIVSHGVCMQCMRGQILPTVPFFQFVGTYCEHVDEGD